MLILNPFEMVNIFRILVDEYKRASKRHLTSNFLPISKKISETCLTYIYTHSMHYNAAKTTISPFSSPYIGLVKEKETVFPMVLKL